MGIPECKKSAEAQSPLRTWHLDAIAHFATISISDSAGRISFANERFLQLTGYKLEELVGKTHKILSSGFHDNAFYRELNQTIHSGLPWTGEIRNRKKTGENYWIHMTIIPIFGTQGKIEEFLTFSNDISDKKKIEEQLLKNLDWSSAVLEGTTFSVITATSDGIISTFNRAAERLLGYKGEELIGKSTPAPFHDLNEIIARSEVLSRALGFEVPPGFRTFVAKAELVGHDTNEWTYIRKDGTRFPVRLCVTCIKNSNGEIVGYLGIAEDLTEQKKLAELVETQRAQMVSTAKLSSLGEMAGGIAHEINNPLAIINGKVGVLRAKLGDGPVPIEKILKDLDKIEHTTMRIAKIIQGLRTFSRNADADPMLLIDLSAVAKETIELCQERFKHAGISLEYDFEPGLSILGRPAQLAQVIMNLLTNAFDAVAELPEKWVRLKTSRADEYVVFQVTDSGQGIPKAIAEKIMSPFFTTKQVGKGTGLGLSISKGLVEMHGGILKFHSESANTCFSVTLPAHDPDT